MNGEALYSLTRARAMEEEKGTLPGDGTCHLGGIDVTGKDTFIGSGEVLIEHPVQYVGNVCLEWVSSARVDSLLRHLPKSHIGTLQEEGPGAVSSFPASVTRHRPRTVGRNLELSTLEGLPSDANTTAWGRAAAPPIA